MVYKLFKKTNLFARFLTPLSENPKTRAAKIYLGDNNYRVGDDEEFGSYLEINQCPRIYVGAPLVVKNMASDEYENLGKVIDIKYFEDVGFVLVFNGEADS